MKRYFIAINSKQQGPFSLEELKQQEINSNTLVWFEGLKDWVKVGEIEELQEIFISSPPALPSDKEKIYSVQAEITKKKNNRKSLHASSATIAYEIKQNFLMLFYAFLITIISFAIFYIAVYNVPKYDNINYEKVTFLTRHHNEVGPHHVMIVNGSSDEELWTRKDVSEPNRVMAAKDAVKRRKERLTQESYSSALITFIIAALILVISRYLIKTIKWVDTSSKLKE